MIIKILATYPVTTASAERNFSLVRRILTYTRSDMSEEMLSSVLVIRSNFDLIEENSVYID